MESFLEYVNKVLGTWYADIDLANVFFSIQVRKKKSETVCIYVEPAKIYMTVLPQGSLS